GAAQHPSGRGPQPRPPHLPVRHQVARRRGLSGAGARVPAEGGVSSKKRGLGRGLDALLAPPAPPAPSAGGPGRVEASVTHLPVASLRPNRFQPRTSFDEAGLDELAESIRTQGIVQPLVVTPEREGGYSIVAGERRFRAAQR